MPVVKTSPGMRKVPLADLNRQHAAMRAELDAAIASVLDSGQFILGPAVESFEAELAQRCGATHAVGVSSGSDALLISLMALGIGPGDEVVTTPFTFFATAGAIARLGARPVFADIEAGSFNLDPAAAAAAVTARTRAILPVHLYGRRARVPETSLPIVEDAAQSIGCTGVLGRVACYSFFPTKNVGALGDAGAVVTGDAALADSIRLLRTHGARPKYFHAVLGGNFRIDALQAAVLRVKLQHLERFTAARRQNAAHYRELFGEQGLGDAVRLPEGSPEHVYHQFTIRAQRRDELQAHLKACGVGTEVYYPQPLHLQRCFADLGHRAGEFPLAEAAAAEALSLPIHPELEAEDLMYVVERIAEFYRDR